MSRTAVRSADLREHFSQVNRLVPVRVVTVVPGIEYYGTVLSVGADHVVLETEYHVVTVALAHVISTHREPFGLLPADHRYYAQATAPTVSIDAPAPNNDRGAKRGRRTPAAARSLFGWRARPVRRR